MTENGGARRPSTPGALHATLVFNKQDPGRFG
jgi:hypothetical protein